MRRKAPQVGFADMPAALRDLPPDAPDAVKAGRADWLEEHGLTLVEYFGWLRSRNPEAVKRPPARRKLLSPKERARLDAERELEGAPLW
jgi:hypothetical protein